MENAPIIITKHTPAFWRITLDNPPLNLLDPEMIDGMSRLMDELDADKEVKVIVFDSSDKNYFIAHYDVMRGSEVPKVSGKYGVNQWTDISNRLHNSPVVSIASVRGRARGNGSEFLLACDMRFASKEKAFFGQIEVGCGVIAGGGALEYLPSLVGRSRALEIVIGGDDFDADTAALYGWINRALPDDQLDDFVNGLAIRIASYEAGAIATTKAIVNRRSGGGPNPHEIDESLSHYTELSQNPNVQILWSKLGEMGFQQPGDLELNFGYYLGKLAEDKLK
ncbi:enoyl-CoA hydratase/isomerase family protein [Dyadobacter sp. UP-52]|uniref:Enoyl-CoA hydratase/isomerase family protein n=2 Tax=Dyadobacter subterraneus TaxID=2773304 RepID=A0ABR9WKV0_9BACT|nr:enoyl-CoA hydratase/isomerase family protein [Dyadobacter subterraneus]